jgi:hypothetical protein
MDNGIGLRSTQAVTQYEAGRGGNMGPTEEQLSAAFADQMKQSPEFCSWVLQWTKFAELSSEMKLLHEKQFSLRMRNFWWKDWWCKPPQLKKGRQMDVFAVFEITGIKRNVALLIENKRGSGRFTDEAQAEDYRAVAEHMKNDNYYMNFVDYETLIIAPQSFLDLHPEKAKLFDSKIPYEEIAGQVLLFASPA